MIICKTPLRISFFGGGTDFPEWYLENGGRVISSTFDKYCYISLRELPPFFEHKHRIVYSKIEHVSILDQIEHPSVRETLKYFDIDKGLEIHHDGDLPARSGLGSSSSFTVGLIKALISNLGLYKDIADIARIATSIEQDKIGEYVGSQDQLIVTYGGLNIIDFYTDGNFSVEPIPISSKRKELLNDHLLLFFTGISRFSSEISKSQVENISQNKLQLREISDLTNQALKTLMSNDNIEDFGRLLNESWNIKKTLSKNITNNTIDQAYKEAMKAGALGGKILGAGGGGFMLIFAAPENHFKIKEALSSFTHVPFEFETEGTKVVLHQESGL